MFEKKLYYIVLSLMTVLAPVAWGQDSNSRPPEHAIPADGPYLLYAPEGKMRIISVDTTGLLNDQTIDTLVAGYELPVVSHNGKHAFQVALHPVLRPAWKYRQSGKVLVLTDPHGNMDCLVSVLRGNGVINEQYGWVFGRNHLVIIGDVFDRGKDVIPIFWLIYKLEKEAQDAGGNVSFLLGNHETMVLAGDLRYAEKMYPALAKKLGMKYSELVGADTELGRWLATRNTMQLIGNDLYVHAGISQTLSDAIADIPRINEEVSRALFLTKNERSERSSLAKLLFGNDGPIWYRGMVRNDERYHPLYAGQLDLILQRFRVKRIFVGHTIVPNVRSFYQGKVWAVNVDNQENFEKVLSRGVLIIGKNTYVIGDKGVLGGVF